MQKCLTGRNDEKRKRGEGKGRRRGGEERRGRKDRGREGRGREGKGEERRGGEIMRATRSGARCLHYSVLTFIVEYERCSTVRYHFLYSRSAECSAYLIMVMSVFGSYQAYGSPC